MQKNEITREMKQFDVTIVLLTVKEKKEEGESEEAVEKNVKEKVKLKKQVNLKLYHQNSIANSMNCQTICVNSKGLMNS